ncbi:hypothetical protein C2G38_2175546 [Gigaspora rosea]|uniref:BACK domain-containing protein n=1 Tax=Gigaspora rosea TaxID=44941 RepID=A0A397VIZ9_9GLOM|nr:hypothetical protein C2G38_2175546 [Gigaspora rosea]
MAIKLFEKLSNNFLELLDDEEDFDKIINVEAKIWKYVIGWGIEQNPGIPSDPKIWSNDNFLTMKTTLQNCLPHIRYFQISSDDVINHLQPYRRRLDDNL